MDIAGGAIAWGYICPAVNALFSSASVAVDGATVARIGPGLLVLLGIAHDDDAALADRVADKVRALRVFPDPATGRMDQPLGERHTTETHLIPIALQVAAGQRAELQIHGTSYPTADGTCVRDYIHVEDLAAGHIAALKALEDTDEAVHIWNLGSGHGTSVLQMLHAFEKAVGRELPYEVVARRPGDVLDLTANPALANEELQWKTELTMEKACEDLWRWVDNNPQGYRQDPPAKLLDAVKKTN